MNDGGPLEGEPLPEQCRFPAFLPGSASKKPAEGSETLPR